jgi:hypothetical protein
MKEKLPTSAGNLLVSLQGLAQSSLKLHDFSKAEHLARRQLALPAKSTSYQVRRAAMETLAASLRAQGKKKQAQD